ncbi:hypothetical protein [Sinorhizobium fredii]|uniref:hypothetical protein n=1 Tax=Rhizobium fredii TaxID=380 RepID=UPI000307357C
MAVPSAVEAFARVEAEPLRYFIAFPALRVHQHQQLLSLAVKQRGYGYQDQGLQRLTVSLIEQAKPGTKSRVRH